MLTITSRSLFVAALLLLGTTVAEAQGRLPPTPQEDVRRTLAAYREQAITMRATMGGLHGVALERGRDERKGGDFATLFEPGTPAAKLAADAEGKLGAQMALSFAGVGVEVAAVVVGLALGPPAGLVVMLGGLGVALVAVILALPLFQEGRDLLERAVRLHNDTLFEQLTSGVALPPPPTGTPAS